MTQEQHTTEGKEAMAVGAVHPWEREAENAERLGKLFAAEKANSDCDYMVCTYPTDGNCWCFNRALAQYSTPQGEDAQQALSAGGGV